MSFLVYCIHSWINVPIMATINKVMKVSYGREIYSLIYYLLVLVLSMIIAALFIFLAEKKKLDMVKEIILKRTMSRTPPTLYLKRRIHHAIL